MRNALRTLTAPAALAAAIAVLCIAGPAQAQDWDCYDSLDAYPCDTERADGARADYHGRAGTGCDTGAPPARRSGARVAAHAGDDPVQVTGRVGTTAPAVWGTTYVRDTRGIRTVVPRPVSSPYRHAGWYCGHCTAYHSHAYTYCPYRSRSRVTIGYSSGHGLHVGWSRSYGSYRSHRHHRPYRTYRHSWYDPCR